MNFDYLNVCVYITELLPGRDLSWHDWDLIALLLSLNLDTDYDPLLTFFFGAELRYIHTVLNGYQHITIFASMRMPLSGMA